jgi:hypothetical protein
MMARAKIAYTSPKTTSTCTSILIPHEGRFQCNLNVKADDPFIDMLPLDSIKVFKTKVDQWAKENGNQRVTSASRFKDPQYDIMFLGFYPDAYYYLIGVGDGCDWTQNAPGYDWKSYRVNNEEDPAKYKAYENAMKIAKSKKCVFWVIENSEKAKIAQAAPPADAIMGMYL